MSYSERLFLLPEELLNLVWGPAIQPELFSRWTQGFLFSSHESTALIQTNGGPCAVIAPIQAFLLQRLTSLYQMDELGQLDEVTLNEHLALTLSDVLCQCGVTNDVKRNTSETHSTNESSLQSTQYEGPFRLACLDDPLPPSKDRSPTCTATVDNPHAAFVSKDHEPFHSSVRLRHFDGKSDLEEYLKRNITKFKLEFGILLFLYSVVLTKGINRVREEMGESNESLIERTEGHGTQALINLLICGRASPYVWDEDKIVDGLKLCGIIHRPKIGFLTRMEELQYVQVGWYLKNPLNPIWVLASETHLTVLFSWCRALITPDSEIEKAKQILSWFDAEGNHFIQRSQLKDVLDKLNLCTDDNFIEFMCKELDPENIGIILFQSILDAFCDVSQSYSPPDTFKVFHFNGIESSCPNSKVQYADGRVTLQESHVDYSSNSSDVLACLNTKWRNLDIQWLNFQPSLN